MRVTDSPKASLAATLLAASFGANLGLMLLSMAVTRLLTPSFDGPWFMVEQLLWLGSTVVTVVGLLMLANAVEERGLPMTTAVLWILMALVDLVSMLGMRGGLGVGGMWLNDLNMLVSLTARVAVLALLAKISVESRAWLLPLLATVAVLSVGRSALSVALMHGVLDRELYRLPAYSLGTFAVSLFNAVAVFVAALVAKTVIGGAQAMPARERAGLVPATEEQVSPASDFLVGGILLAVGIGVTLMTLAAASNGGRYIVATGAIGVGLGRLIRGFIRLGKSSP
ncbi:MAG: hypothetical protein ACOZQL_28165 [Myxococcota bacterium]